MPITWAHSRLYDAHDGYPALCPHPAHRRSDFQFDVHRNPHPRTRTRAPYLLVLQNDVLRDLRTTVAAPLIAEAHCGRPARTLNPVFEIEGQRVVLSTAEVAGISHRQLGEHLQSLAPMRDEILAAVDLLFTGI